MSSHVIRVAMVRGMYRWTCSCGRSGKRGYGYIGLAERYGMSHASAKNGK